MRIQHNIAALNTHRALGSNQAAASKNLEKLSSGYQINRAGDDAAGLAISEKMRGQISGLDMASKNANDGISLIQTAEGALNETHAILQRMRELAVQAGNDTNTADDRGQLQKEMDQLTSEINRIGNTTEFNTKKLVNGELSDKYSAEKATFTDVTRAKDQTVNVVSGKAVTWSNSASKDVSQADINLSITGTTDNGVDWNAAVTKAKSATPGGATASITIKATTSGFTLEGKVVSSTGGKSTTISATALSYDNSTETYSFDSQGIKVSFTKDQVKDFTNGENVKIDLTKAADLSAINTGTKDQYLTVASGNSSISDFKVEGSKLTDLGAVDVTFVGKAAGKGDVTVKLRSSTTATGTLQEYTFANVSTGAKLNFDQDGVSFTFEAGTITGTDTKSSGTFTLQKETVKTEDLRDTQDKSLKFQIGANENQSLSVSIGDMRADALGIVGSGKGFQETATVTDGTNAEAVEKSLDISTHENAASAITTIDAAINKVSTQRSQLGAVQNRLEHTINNLGTTSENLTAAESRIRDTDMAKEMMDFTKNNILTQAAQSMLAQANQQPQGVLSLLQ